MNKIRRTAEELVNRHPTLFSGDFEKNKEALEQVAIIHTRSIRNQLAGAITKIMHVRGPPEAAEGEETTVRETVAESATIGDRVRDERANFERESPTPEKQGAPETTESSSQKDNDEILSSESKEGPISQSAQ